MPAWAAGAPVDGIVNTSWGKMIPQTNGTGVMKLEVQELRPDGRLVLPTGFPEITAAYVVGTQTKEFLKWGVDQKSGQKHLELPQKERVGLPINIVIEIGDKSGQLVEGRIVFLAPDARVTGNHAKLASDGGNHGIVVLSDETDSVSWEFKPTRWGMYDIELSYSAKEVGGAEWRMDVAGKSLTVAAPPMDDAEKYTTVSAGQIYLEKAEPFTVRVGCKFLKGDSTINLKSVTLRPAPEGRRVAQIGAEPVMLHGSNAITHSVMMRYEPAEKKQCLGYWVNPTDWAEWTFELIEPGTYEVELWQGCGKGQGGSEVQVLVNGEKFPFVVEETGGFQNFVPRKIGKVKFALPGKYSLEVRPQSKKAAAVMDVQQVKLVPVSAP